MCSYLIWSTLTLHKCQLFTKQTHILWPKKSLSNSYFVSACTFNQLFFSLYIIQRSLVIVISILLFYTKCLMRLGPDVRLYLIFVDFWGARSHNHYLGYFEEVNLGEGDLGYFPLSWIQCLLALTQILMVMFLWIKFFQHLNLSLLISFTCVPLHLVLRATSRPAQSAGPASNTIRKPGFINIFLNLTWKPT